MPAYNTPGVYFRHEDRSRPAVGPLRTDIAGFVGYAERGPVLRPVKVHNKRQCETVFGAPLPFAFLAHAVQGFFENGGAACYVTRIADPDAARAAALILPNAANDEPALRCWASFGEIPDPATGRAQTKGGHPVRACSPGAWGNRLAVSVLPGGLGSTVTLGPQPHQGRNSLIESLSGFRAGSVVRVSQRDRDNPQYRRIEAIDARTREITWDAPLTGFDFDTSIRLESLEFTLLVHLDGQIAERHTNMSLSARHDRYVVDVLLAESTLLDAAFLCPEGIECDLEAPGPGHDSSRWPRIIRVPLTGGQDGLATVGKDHFLKGLKCLEAIDEVSVLAAPDAVAVPEAPRPVVRAEGTVSSCTKIESPPAGRLLGRVLEAGTQDVPLAAVKVAVLGGTVQATTDTDGTFRLTGLPVGRVSLLLSKDGYFEGEKTAEARALVPAEPAPFFLTPVTLPPKLSLDDLFEVQTTMLHQGEAGLYRVALLDPPQEMLSVEAIQTWRARFDSAYAALYFPWVKVDDASNGNLREMPPSGHMAGLIARTDLQRGVHRAPANFVLQGVKALTLEIDDATQGVLNPLGVNCLRVLTGRGLRVYGARTVSSDAVWLYLNVRRLLLMIEETIEESNHWAVFEPNNETLRQALTFNLNGFLDTLWRQGALAGDSPEAAYQVRCDAENNTPDIVDAGKVIADIAVAPTIPYEFIHLRLGRTVEAVQVSER